MSDEKEILVEQVRDLPPRDPGERDSTAAVLGERRRLSDPMDENAARKEMRRRSLRTFLFGGATAAIGFFAWRWMPNEWKWNTFRRTFEVNEKISRFFYRPTRLAPEFSRSQISPRRVNGLAGMETELDATQWKLYIGGLFGRNTDLALSLDEIKSLPRTEMTTELMCIEGWSVVVHWAGVRFSDLIGRHLPNTTDGSPPDPVNHPERLLPYVSLTTPDNGYFVGWDMPSILHPQTLLAYEMNGEPLLPEHGAPLRLASPTKYGIKQIKRIGRIEFTADRPRDYWAESGYDWYAGL